MIQHYWWLSFGICYVTVSFIAAWNDGTCDRRTSCIHDPVVFNTLMMCCTEYILAYGLQVALDHASFAFILLLTFYTLRFFINISHDTSAFYLKHVSTSRNVSISQNLSVTLAFLPSFIPSFGPKSWHVMLNVDI